MGSLGTSDSTPISKSNANGHASELEASPSKVLRNLLAEKISGDMSRSESAKRKIKNTEKMKPKIVIGDGGYVLEDVPHLSDYIPDLHVLLSLSLSLLHTLDLFFFFFPYKLIIKEFSQHACLQTKFSIFGYLSEFMIKIYFIKRSNINAGEEYFVML